MVIAIVSFNGTNLNSGSYQSYFVSTSAALGRSIDPIALPVVGGFPRDEGFDYQASSFQVCVLLVSGAMATGQAALQALFAVGTYAALIVNDGTQKQRMCRVTQTFPWAGAPGRFIVTLQAADPRWRATSDATHTEQNTATGHTWVVNNAGNAPVDDLVLTITPQTAKAAANGWRYRRYVHYANRVGRPLGDWPVDLTNGGIDHATLVGGGKSLASGNDVRVLQDGGEIERYFGENAATDPNSATTKIWATPYMPAMRDAHLLNAITNVSPATGSELLVQRGETALWPDKGYFVIETTGEVVSYDGIAQTNADGYAAFQNIKRGQRGTTAAAASAGDHLLWLPHRYEIIYGHTGAAAPEARPDRKPLLDLASSTLTNTRHEWINFYDDTYPDRPGGWRRVLEARDTDSGLVFLPGGSPAANIDFEYNWTSVPTSKNNQNVVRRSIPVGTDGTSGHLAFSRTIDQTMMLVPLGTASDSVERQIGTSPLLGPLTVATFSAGAGSKLYEVALYAKTQIARSITEVPSAPLPTGALEFRQVAGINASGALYQAITNDADEPIIVTAVYAMFSEPTTPVRACTLRVLADNGSGAPNTGVVLWGPLTIAAGSINAAGQWLGGTPNQFVILPGQTVHLELSTSGTGSNVVWWGNGAELAYRIAGIGPVDEQAHATHGHKVTLDNAVIKLDSTATPYFAMSAEADLYWLNGTLTNNTTGQSIRFSIFTALVDQIEVNVGAGTVRNLTTGEEGLVHRITPSDPSRWLTLAPGNNTLQWDETGVVRVDVASAFRAAWE